MNKLSFIKSGLVVIAALVLASCSKAEEFQYNPDSMLQIASVSGISPFDLMQNQASKAVITGDSLPDDEAEKGIGLFVTATGGGAYDGHDKGYTNVKYTFDGSKWSTQSPIYLSSNEGNLYGYFPYNPDATDLRAIPVESSLNGTDYLYANPMTVNHSEKNVTLQMNHALSRLHLTIKKGENFTADASLSEITLKSAAIDATGTMDLTTGAITPAKKSSETGTVELPADGTITAEGIEKDILLVPADGTEGKKDIAIILAIGNKLASVTLTETGGLDIRSGIQNNVTLTIEDTGIKVTGVDVGVWSEGGSQQVQVGEHTVTVKFSDDEGIAKDVMATVYKDHDNVIIKASSSQGMWLVCNVGDNAKCERIITNDTFTFTISEISSNIDAVLGYSPVATLTVTYNSNGKVWIGDDESKISGQFEIGEQVEIHAAPDDGFIWFKWDDNNRAIDRTITIGESGNIYSASFISSNLIPGLFTVNSSGKQVFFSKGNLYWDGKKYDFEANQYSTPPTGNESEEHVAHFYWSSNENVARSLSHYSDSGASGSDVFFANHPDSFEVNGYKGWSVLTGGSNGEWKYLIDRKGGALFKSSVKVFDSENCLILLPDDWKWGENGVGSGWTSEYSESTPVKWSTMEAAGAVCLPAASSRNGGPSSPDPKYVYPVGDYGYYQSAYPSGDSDAANLHFDNSGNVDPFHFNSRKIAMSVRLVTDVK